MTVLPTDKYTFLLQRALEYNRVRIAEGKVTQHGAGSVTTQRLGLFSCTHLNPSSAKLNEQLSASATAAHVEVSPSKVEMDKVGSVQGFVLFDQNCDCCFTWARFQRSLCQTTGTAVSHLVWHMPGALGAGVGSRTPRAVPWGTRTDLD